MTSSYETLSIDERHKATRAEFVLFVLCRLCLFVFVAAVMGCFMRGVLDYTMLAFERAFPP